MRKLVLSLILSMWATVAHAAAEGPQTFTMGGRLYTSTAVGAPTLLDSGVMVVQVLSPDATCILYEESQNFDTTTTDGAFTLTIGSAVGAVKRTASDSGNGMATVFSNTIISGINGKLSSDGTTNCTYTPVASEARLARVKVTPVSDGVTRTLSPDLTLNSVPGAMVAERAETLQGLAPASLLQLGAGSTTQSNIDNVFSATNYPRLTDLLSVGTGSYVRESANGAALAPTVAGNAATPSAGQFWYDTTNNVMKYYNGTAVRTVGTVSTGSDLTTGTIGGSVAVNTSGDIATSGNITASGNGTTTGVITGQTVATNQVNANLLRMADQQGTPKYIEFKAPASIGASNLAYTWPSGFPASNMVLQSDNAGILSWVAQSGGGSGDLKADGTVAMSANWDMNGATAGGSILLTGLADPSANDGAATKASVDSAIATAAGSYVTKDGLTGLTADWDANGATAGGTRLITGLASPAVADGAATKGYTDGNWLGLALAAPTGAEVGKAVRWNAGGTAWEYFTPGNGNGDALVANPLSQFAATTSAQLAGVISNETGTGLAVFDTTPTIKGFTLGGATSGGVVMQVAATGAVGTYTWPSAAPASTLVLHSDNAGGLSWAAPVPADDSIDFAKLADNMSLDVSTDIAVGANLLSITNDGVGNSFVVNDNTSVDTTPFVIGADGSVGIGTSTATSTLTVNGSLARNIVTVTAANYTVADTDTHIIANRNNTITLTLPAAASFPGREITVRTINARSVASASSNVVPLLGGAAGTAIVAATDGKWALLVSDGTNWQIQMAN